MKQNHEHIKTIPIENFFSTICGCEHWTQRREQQHESNIEGRHLERKHEVKEAHAVEERAGMQRIWNDPSQATEAKELRGAKAAERLKKLTNPEIFSLRGKDNAQSRKKQEWTEYTLTRSYGPSQVARRDEKGKEPNKGVALWN